MTNKPVKISEEASVQMPMKTVASFIHILISSANSSGGGLILGTLLHSLITSSCVLIFICFSCSAINSSVHADPKYFL